MEKQKKSEERQKEKNSETEMEQLDRDRMKTKVINRERLISCQTKISMGVKRKTELSEELKQLDSKIKKEEKEVLKHRLLRFL